MTLMAQTSVVVVDAIIKMKALIQVMLLLLTRSMTVRAFGVLQQRRFVTKLAAATTSDSTKKIPIHLLAGFLGAGKTSTLKNLLENTENEKIGVIVNDVASINIDAKLVNQDITTSNGGEVLKLQNGCACCSLADEFLVSLENLLSNTKEPLDAIVVELSGVADPVAIQNNWRQAIRTDKQVTEQASLENIVTCVDACTFGTDYFTWDVARDRWENSNNRQVVELLAEQVEAANVILLNKQDLATPAEMEVAQKMCKSLNPDAQLITTTYGKVSASKILDLASRSSDDSAVAATSSSESKDATSDSSHSHSHDHACQDPDCTDASHDHDHASSSSSCTDPDCTDTSHSHSHDHTGVDNLGISNFCYKATRPFQPERLSKILFSWPIPNKDELDSLNFTNAYEEDFENSPFVGVVRSKGFCWLAPSNWNGMLQDAWRHDEVMYWSHAGKHLGVQPAGTWWAAVGEEGLKEFFSDNPGEYERVLKEDFVTEEWGDRRQELVFIGVNLQEDKIRVALDECLLTDEEMEEYREELAKLNKLIEEEQQRQKQQEDKSVKA